MRNFLGGFGFCWRAVASSEGLGDWGSLVTAEMLEEGRQTARGVDFHHERVEE